MKRLALALLFLVVFGCATSSPDGAVPTNAAGPETDRTEEPAGEGVGFPVRLDHGFRLVDRHDYEDPRLGIQLTYITRQHRLRVDVYLYPMAPPGVTLSDTARAAQLERAFEQAERDIRTYEQRGRYQNVTEVGEAEVLLRSDADPIRGRHGHLRLDMDGRRYDSHLYVFTFARYFVKLRSTFRKVDAPDRTPILDAFVEAFVPALRVGR